MEFREVQIRTVDTELREAEGTAFPYNKVTDLGDGTLEKFERGDHAFTDDALVFYGHDHRNGGMPIGRVIESRDSDDGKSVRIKISETAKGDEVYRLLRDGVLKKFSVGFEPIESRMEDGVVVRSKSRIHEVSVVPFPAYAAAGVSEVRSEATHTEKETDVAEIVTEAADLTELRDTVTDLERRLAVLGERDERPAASQFRSGGEFLKALADRDESAQLALRDFGTLADADGTSRPAWLSRPLQIVQEKRQIINLFGHAPLPATGNSVEYPFVSSTSGTVGQQVNEGDALNYLEVALDTATSPVKTYGGYSSLSRQAIERSDMAYLDAVLRYQAVAYAKATNAAVVTSALSAVSGAPSGVLGGNTASDWIEVVYDGAGSIEDHSVTDLTAGFMVVSRDVAKRIVSLADDNGRPIFGVKSGGVNILGGANPVTATFDIAGMPGVVVGGLPANTCFIAAAGALTVLESAGAPFRLADEDIIHLTKDFSLYGYMAITVNDVKGLYKVSVA